MEEWRDIEGYEGLYQVSNFGRVKSLNYNRTGREEILKPSISYGYYRLCLYNNGKEKMFRVNCLVYEAFVGKIPDGMQVNHINEDKSDNRLENLNLMTPKENINWGTGIERSAEKRSKTVLQYDLDGNLIAEFPSLSEINRQFGYSLGNLSMACNGKYKQIYGYKWQYKNG